jgi:hypothetical protein
LELTEQQKIDIQRGEFVASHQIFLQALAQALRVEQPALMERVRKSLELSIPAMTDDTKNALALALKIATED